MNILKKRNECLKQLINASYLMKRDRDYWVNFLCKIEPLNTAIDEVEKTIRILANYEKEMIFINEREPIGLYRVSLPFNNPIYSFVLYSCGIALGGNEVIVRPSRHTASYVVEFYNTYPQFKNLGISLFLETGKKFISSAYTDKNTSGILFTGAYDHLKDIMNNIPINKHLIYCGSGYNPVILGKGIRNIDKAIDIVIDSRIYNSGQDCLCSEKIIVHTSIYDEFLKSLCEKLSKLKLGNFGDKNADIYPPFDAIKDEIKKRYADIKNSEKCIFNRTENGCILSVFEVDINSQALNSEKFCPIFTIAKYSDENDLLPILLSEYKFGIIVLGDVNLNLFNDFPHIVTSGTVMQTEAMDAHIPFGGRGKSGFSMVNNWYKDGPILFSYETTKNKLEEFNMKTITLDTRHFYGGEHHDSFGDKTFQSINPATQEVIATIPEANEQDISAAIDAAKIAFKEWNQIDVITRGHLINLIADAIEEHSEELVNIDVQDAGRPILDATEDIEAVVRMYRYFGGLPDKIEGVTIPFGNEKLVFTKREPYGVIAAITAWNYPLFNNTAKIAPIIATGNACILKPAEETPLVALRLAEIIANVPGVPKGLVSVLNGSGETTGNALVANANINKITFTGSTQTAKLILNNISNNNVKNCTFELGGKAPVVVFDDANIDGAAKAIAFCAFFNQGQTCTAATRIIVEKGVHDILLEKLKEIASRIVIGDPTNKETTLGPLVSKAQYDKVNGYLKRAIERNEKMILGDERTLPTTGYYVCPTIFDNISPNSELFTDEVFGPVLTVTTFEDEKDAIRLANNSEYGLAASVWTKDIDRMHRLAYSIKCGIMQCNTIFCEFPGAPAGGYKNSGYGREFGKEAITEYTQIKTVWVSYSDDYSDWV